MAFDWKKLLCATRFSHLEKKRTRPQEADSPPEKRKEWERDYDRILFSTPVRRLADKTQVFPLETNDSVRTRLTHSHEVSNLARSLGLFLTHRSELDGLPPRRTSRKRTQSSAEALELAPEARRAIPSVLAAIGLAHDLGNPPFGHQGEKAIQRWFFDHAAIFKPKLAKDPKARQDIALLTPAMKEDFLKFEGNAQTFRILTRLQTVTDDLGLNLTLGTLAAVLKYPVPSDKTKEGNPTTKKHGFFQSERDVVRRVHSETGLSIGQRHPLTWLMEACDDTAYLVLDAEDAIKKGLVSVSDLLAFLEAEAPDDAVVGRVVKLGKRVYADNRKLGLSPSELNDSTAQRIRAKAITEITDAVTNSFDAHYSAIMDGTLDQDLIGASAAGPLARILRKFDVSHAYQHRSVLSLELRGFNALYELMDMLWLGITQRRGYLEPESKRTDPFAAFAYGRISENYRRIFEGKTLSSSTLPIRYRECQLLTDMVSGMTDNFALSLHEELNGYRKGPSRGGIG